MVKPELGTKRVCPETGRKFYDLNKDPIVSPYTGQSYPRSYFDAGVDKMIDDEEDEVEEKELDIEEEDAPEVVSLEDADEEVASGDKAEIPDIDGDDDDDVDLGDDDDATFLEEDEDEEDDDVKDFIGVGDDDEDR